VGDRVAQVTARATGPDSGRVARGRDGTRDAAVAVPQVHGSLVGATHSRRPAFAPHRGANPQAPPQATMLPGECVALCRTTSSPRPCAMREPGLHYGPPLQQAVLKIGPRRVLARADRAAQRASSSPQEVPTGWERRIAYHEWWRILVLEV